MYQGSGRLLDYEGIKLLLFSFLFFDRFFPCLVLFLSSFFIGRIIESVVSTTPNDITCVKFTSL